MSYKVTVLKNKATDKASSVTAFKGLVDFVLRPSLIAEVLRSEAINLREGNAHTKTRGEVRGGGKKPWRQKGTGRARHGSIRSPLWVGGGATFGPRNTRNWFAKINKKAKVTALKSFFKDRLDDKNVYVLEEGFSYTKTKDTKSFLTKTFKNLPKNAAVLYTSEEKDKLNGFSNLDVNLVNVANIRFNKLAKGTVYILTPGALTTLEERLK
jgi:large subunit ribosomal protein L4